MIGLELCYFFNKTTRFCGQELRSVVLEYQFSCLYFHFFYNTHLYSYTIVFLHPSIAFHIRSKWMRVSRRTLSAWSCWWGGRSTSCQPSSPWPWCSSSSSPASRPSSPTPSSCSRTPAWGTHWTASPATSWSASPTSPSGSSPSYWWTGQAKYF